LVKKLTLFLLLLSAVTQAQKWDSTYYTKCSDRFTAGIFYSFRQSDFIMTQKLFTDTASKSSVNYFAQSATVFGFDFTYDKLSLSFGIKSTPQPNADKTGQTKHFNLGLNIGGNRWLLENYVRTFTGFYDKNTSRYDTTFKTDGVYYQQPRLVTGLLKVKFLYFTNHKKFAYKSGYSCSYRQFKTAASWILGGSFTINGLQGDSTIVPYNIRQLYDTTGQKQFRGMVSSGVAFYAGGSANIVIKKALFLNLTFLVGPDFQSRTYYYTNSAYDQKKGFVSYSGSAGISFGFNFKKGYIALSSASDFHMYDKFDINLSTKFVSGSLIIGYRFPVKTPGFYRKFQETKLYKLF